MTISSFVETRIEVGKLYGTVGGPSFNTSIAETGGGFEKRNSNHSNNLGRWDLGSRNLITKDIEYLHRFFRARRGRTQGFRFKDFLNYLASDESISVDGSTSIQLYKGFTEGGVTEQMIIQKPISSGFSMERNASSFTDFSLDDTTGIVTLTNALNTENISNVTQANPGVVTTQSNHNFTTGDPVTFVSIGGMTELNEVGYTITVLTATTFSIGVDTSGYGAYTSGGQVERYLLAGDTLTWSGEFDMPVRFDTDQFKAEFLLHRDDVDKVVYRLESLPIVGLKL